MYDLLPFMFTIYVATNKGPVWEQHETIHVIILRIILGLTPRVFLPHAHAQRGKVIGSVVVVVIIKIARSRVLVQV